MKCRWIRGWLVSQVWTLACLWVAAVIEHDMQLAAWIGASDQLEEAQELTVPVSRVTGVGHVTGGHLQGGKQRGGAVPDIIVGAPLDPARRHRPDRSVGRPRSWRWSPDCS